MEETREDEKGYLFRSSEKYSKIVAERLREINDSHPNVDNTESRLVRFVIAFSALPYGPRSALSGSIRIRMQTLVCALNDLTKIHDPRFGSVAIESTDDDAARYRSDALRAMVEVNQRHKNYYINEIAILKDVATILTSREHFREAFVRSAVNMFRCDVLGSDVIIRLSAEDHDRLREDLLEPSVKRRMEELRTKEIKEEDKNEGESEKEGARGTTPKESNDSGERTVPLEPVSDGTVERKSPREEVRADEGC